MQGDKDMRPHIQRRDKYAAKTSGDVAKDRVIMDGDRQKRAFSVVSGEQVGVERLVKRILEQYGVMPGLNHYYMNFAKKIWKDKRMYSGDTLVTEVCAERDHWELRGLNGTVMDDIISRMALPACEEPVPACPWLYKRKLTFSGNVSATDLDDFPVLVHFTNHTFDFTHCQSLGQDIRFMDSDTCPSDGTPLKHEIEHWLWDSETGEGDAWIWVKVPRIDGGSVNDFIYIFYGNAGAPDGQDPTEVWDGDFEAVWHLKGDGTRILPDSTIAGLNATKRAIGEPANNTGSKVDGGQTFDGQNDDATTGNITGSYNLTIEMWLNIPASRLTGSGENGTLIKWDGVTNWNNIDWLLRTPDGANVVFYVSTTVGNQVNVSEPIASVSAGNWQHWTFVGRSANYLKIYIDGTEVANVNTVKVFKAMTKRLDIGRDYLAINTDRWFKDHMDELRLSNIVRTPDWIMANWKSQDLTLITWGAEEPA